MSQYKASSARASSSSSSNSTPKRQRDFVPRTSSVQRLSQDVGSGKKRVKKFAKPAPPPLMEVGQGDELGGGAGGIGDDDMWEDIGDLDEKDAEKTESPAMEVTGEEEEEKYTAESEEPQIEV